MSKLTLLLLLSVRLTVSVVASCQPACLYPAAGLTVPLPLPFLNPPEEYYDSYNNIETSSVRGTWHTVASIDFSSAV